MEIDYLDYEFDYEFDEDEDIFFDDLDSCNLEDCIMPGSHFESECHTAKDIDDYYKLIDKEHCGSIAVIQLASKLNHN